MSFEAQNVQGPRPTESTHIVSLRTGGSLRTRQTPVALLSLFTRRSDETNETGVTLGDDGKNRMYTRSIH